MWSPVLTIIIIYEMSNELLLRNVFASMNIQISKYCRKKVNHCVVFNLSGTRAKLLRGDYFFRDQSLLLLRPYAKDLFAARNIRVDDSHANLANISHTRMKVSFLKSLL